MTVSLIPKVVAVLVKAGEYPYDYSAAEEDIPEGAAVAKSDTTGGIVLAQADVVSRMPCFGISVEEREVGELCKVISIGIGENVQRTEDFTYGESVYVSTEKGKLTRTPPETQGTFVQVVGKALNGKDIVIFTDATVVEYR